MLLPVVVVGAGAVVGSVGVAEATVETFVVAESDVVDFRDAGTEVALSVEDTLGTETALETEVEIDVGTETERVAEVATVREVDVEIDLEAEAEAETEQRELALLIPSACSMSSRSSAIKPGSPKTGLLN